MSAIGRAFLRAGARPSRYASFSAIANLSAVIPREGAFADEDTIN
jgi:hypothetical protein